MSLVEFVATDPTTHRPRMTSEEFLALPDDGVDRMLLDGEVWEIGMMVRNRHHSFTECRMGYFLTAWELRQTPPLGMFHSGEAGFRFPDGSVVGIDVAYASPELVARTSPENLHYESPPTLAIEILSPSDNRKTIIAKFRKYLQAGVVVWEVDPEFRHIRVHRPDLPIESYNVTQELIGDPYLPGFRVEVAKLFVP